MRHRTSSTRGFTLMELMFTLGIAALLAAVGVPAFRSMVANNRLASEGSEVVAAINFARSEAIAKNKQIRFCRVNLEASTNCATSSSEWDYFIVREVSTSTVLRRGALPDFGGTVSFESDLTIDQMTFTPDGLASTGGAVISENNFTVCSTKATGENIRYITIGSGSRVSTSKDTGDCS